MNNMNKAWVASVNMGYGHQRTAHPLKNFAYKNQIINANDYPGIPRSDRKIWEESRKFYEAISKFKRAPVIGNAAFYCYDNFFQKIIEFYPCKDLSRPTFLTKRTYGLIKQGWGKDFVERLAKNPMPLVTTFFIPAFMAEEFGYPGEIYLVVCDADVSRQWAPQNPLSSRINYCAPTRRVYDRLKLYGISKRRLFLTGYPLPESNISAGGGRAFWKMATLKKDLGARLANLDRGGAYLLRYHDLVRENLGAVPETAGRPLTIMFSSGGAGAQGEIGIAIARQLERKIKHGYVKLILSVGTNRNMRQRYLKFARQAGIAGKSGFEILFEEKIGDYFNRFNKTLRSTDILWTKPSELSFYSALGLPIIVAPPIGSQEDFNKSWLLKSGFGLAQEDMACIDQWLDDWLEQGYLAEAAMEGFIEGEKFGARNIEQLVANERKPN